MRISDWSSDVCSSDLGLKRLQRHRIVARDPARGIPRARLELGLYLIFGLEPTDEHVQLELADDTHDHIGAYFGIADLDDPLLGHELGRAEGRTRVCAYVKISVEAASLKKKQEK